MGFYVKMRNVTLHLYLCMSDNKVYFESGLLISLSNKGRMSCENYELVSNTLYDRVLGSKGKFLEKAELQWSLLERYIDQLCTFKMSFRVTSQTASLKVMPALLTWTQNTFWLQCL